MSQQQGDSMQWDPYAPRTRTTPEVCLVASVVCSLAGVPFGPALLTTAAVVLAALAVGFGRAGAGLSAIGLAFVVAQWGGLVGMKLLNALPVLP